MFDHVRSGHLPPPAGIPQARSRLLRIVFDYVDPGSYVTHSLLERWLDPDDAARMVWCPLELRPPSRPALDPTEERWSAMSRGIQREAELLDVPFEAPDRLPRTRKAIELALLGRVAGAFPSLHRALFRAHFVEGRDLGRVDVLVSIASEQGLDAAEVRTVLGVDRFKPELEETRRTLLSEGIVGVPTLISGESRLEGFQGSEELEIFLGAAGFGGNATF